MTQELQSVFQAEHLLNPAFCGCILIKFVEAYTGAVGIGPSVHELFLVLPLTLHHRSREALRKRTSGFGLHRFVLASTEAWVGLSQRVVSYAPYCEQAMLLVMAQGLLNFDEETLRVCLALNYDPKTLSRRAIGRDAHEASLAAQRLGVWFSQLSPAEVFLHLGVKLA